MILLGLPLYAWSQKTEVAPFPERKIFDKNKLYIGLNQSIQQNRSIGTSALQLKYLKNDHFEWNAEIGRSTLEQNNFASNDLFMAPGHWYGAGITYKLRLFSKQKSPDIKSKIFASTSFSRGVTNISTHNYFFGASFDDYVHKSNYPNYRSGLLQLGLGFEFIINNKLILQLSYNRNEVSSRYNYNETYTSPVTQTYGEFPIIYHPKNFGEISSWNLNFSIPFRPKHLNVSKQLN